ncbi:MAG: DgaE family pyridoxal phosphate-dependent ammonia lyase [Oscillospiraceae bacterium]|nr:DgaE family pyridoxal phosphate-dependent ammonia lyase [Oscillospiraceae bacterium]
MSTVYEDIGLRRVVNASGHMTALGVSTISDEVAEAVAKAGQQFVVIDELIDRVGELISPHTGAEDTCVTNSASGGIMISVAACIAGDDIGLIERMPDSTGLRNEIVLQKGHAVNYGVPVEQMIRLGGGVPVEAGQVNSTSAGHIESAITDRTAALFFVKSHHVQQESTISLEEMIGIAHSHGLPIIVDAAAEEDLRRYVAAGADMVIYSGAKAVEGPTSGFITGKKEYIAKCKKQYKGVGRAAKIGKDCMMGIVKAVELYDSRDEEKEALRQREIVESLIEGLSGLESVSMSIKADDAGRKIYRAKLDVVPGKCRYTAKEIVQQLQSGNPMIYTRNHFVDSGTILIDPRTMLPGDAELIVQRIREIAE